MAIIEKTGVLTYLDGDGNEVRLYPKSKNEIADAVISVLSSDWALDETTGMYKQDFTVNGITSESVPVIGLVSTGTPTPDAEAEAYSHITDAVTSDNTLTLYADEALATAITIIIKGISATGGSTVADISNLTASYNELNSNLTFPSGEGFYPDEKDGVKGYNTSSDRGADTFVPFSSEVSFVATIPITLTAISKYSSGSTVKSSAVLHVTVEDGNITEYTIDNNSAQSGTSAYTKITITPNTNYCCASEDKLVLSLNVSVYGAYGSGNTINNLVHIQFNLVEKTIPSWIVTNNTWSTSSVNTGTISYSGNGTIS